MKLYEIQRVGIERLLEKMLMELQGSTIDQELEKTAAGIKDATAARGGDMTGMGEPGMGADAGMGDMGMGMGDAGMGMGMDGTGEMLPAAAGPMGLEPDPSMQAGDGLDQAEELETKKIDAAILSQVQSMDYVHRYDHEGSKISPENILQMEMDELNQLRNAVMNTIRINSMQDKVGLYDDPGIKWYEHLRDFVDKVLNLKKRADQPVKKKRQGKTAKWEEKPKSKNSKTKQYRKPPKPKGA